MLVEICKPLVVEHHVLYVSDQIMEYDLSFFFFLAGAVANLRGCGKESAAILFWVHIFAVFSMAGWIILYLSLLF